MSRDKKKIIRAVTVSQSLGFFRDILIRLQSLGYNVMVISSPGPELDVMEKEDRFMTYRVKMVRHISLLKDIISLFNLITVFIKEKPYIVHSMTPKAGLLCMLAARLTGVPIRIHTFTGLIWPTATGLKRRILIATDRITCACASHVIPEGQGVMNDLKKRGITNKPMKVLGYGNVKGVDMNRFDPKRLEDKCVCRDEDSFTFLFVGRIVGDKGVNDLVEAFTHINKKYKNTRLHIIGEYENEYDPLKISTQEIMDSTPAILVSGAKYGDELIAEYYKADCFVLPSYREGFPNTVLEAGAMGLPSIVTDINGSREIIIEGKNGIIVPPRNVHALYCAMERILSDDNMRNQMKSNARPMIVSRFEKEFVQQCMIDYYKALEKE